MKLSQILRSDLAPASAASVCADAFLAQDEDTQDWLKGIAADIILLHAKGHYAEAVVRLASENLEQEMLLCLWHLLDSKVRSTLKGKR